MSDEYIVDSIADEPVTVEIEGHADYTTEISADEAREVELSATDEPVDVETENDADYAVEFYSDTEGSGSYDDGPIRRELATKTVKTRIDFDGTNFKIGDRVLNFKELHDIHLTQTDFAFVVYGDRAYLLSYVQDDASAMREMRWESSIATDTVVKTSGIYAKSTDGINIASVTVRDINSETQGNKVSSITDATKDSTSYYPSNKAVVDYVAEHGGSSAVEFAIRVEPHDQHIEIGKQATAQLYATGTNLTYQWQYKQGEGEWSNWGTGNPFTNPYLSDISYDGMAYRCIVTNGDGRTITSKVAYFYIANKVTDVKVNGSSVVADGVAEIPKANASGQFGVLTVQGGTGLAMSSGSIYATGASASVIKTGTATSSLIKPNMAHAVAFYGLAKASGDTTQASSSNAVGTYTEEAKTAIKNMLGISEGGSIPTITIDVTRITGLDPFTYQTNENEQAIIESAPNRITVDANAIGMASSTLNFIYETEDFIVYQYSLFGTMSITVQTLNYVKETKQIEVGGFDQENFVYEQFFNSSFIMDYFNYLVDERINTKLGVIENGTY